MVPVAKMIQLESQKYAAYEKFPMGAKVFVNATVSFIDAVTAFKLGNTTASPHSPGFILLRYLFLLKNCRGGKSEIFSYTLFI